MESKKDLDQGKELVDIDDSDEETKVPFEV